jgi:citrate synthase
MIEDPGMRIARPRQIYIGPKLRDYTPIGQRNPAA